MKNIEITIASDGTAVASDKAIGHAGEHLATTLYITLPLEWLPQMDYYRLFFKLKSAIYLTEYITATGDKIIYSVPQAAISAPGTLILQVVGYDSDEENEDGEYKQINKSDNMQFTILESVTGGDLIPGVPKSSLEIAVDEAQKAAAEAAAARDSANQAAENVQISDLRIAMLSRETSELRAALSQMNPNGEPKQTVSGTGAVALPVNAVQGQLNVIIKGNTEDGISVSSAMRVVSESADESERTELYISDYRWLRSGGLFNLADNGEDYENWTVESDITKSVNGLRFAGNFPPPGAIRLATLVVGFKPSTTYTIVFNVTEASGTRDLRIGNNLTGNEIALVTPITPPGLRKIMLTTASTLTDSNLNLHFSGLNNVVIAVALYGIYEGNRSDNPDVDEPRTYGGRDTVQDSIVYNKQTGQYEKIQLVDDEGEPLSAPITTPIAVSGTLIGHPKGTVYFEPVLAVAGIYAADGISVTNEDFAIDTLDRISKIDFDTGVATAIDKSTAEIAADGLSFTHPDLAEGDIVFFTYYHAVTGTAPKLDVEYYDSRYTVEDSVLSGTFYKWKVTVENGTPSLSVEVVS